MSDGDDWTSMPVRKETRERVREVRPEDAHSVDEFVNTLLDAYEPDGGVGNLEPFGGEVPDVSQPGVPTAEEIASAVTKDVKAQLPEAVADELEERLR